ncbi:TIGR00159 family protein [candidate division WOR-3 bacterium]|nr:TIGR00159 family protein [candidate division WOR-3 bacterium]
MKLFGFLPIRAIDVIDIIVVAFMIYAFFRFVKGTKATSILVGLVLFFLISFVSRWLDLKALSWIMNSILTLWVVAFVIVFQPEIRNALARIGRQRPAKFFLKLEEMGVIDEIIDAVKKMSEDHTGALIVIQKSIGLKDIIDTGVKIDAQVNSSLLRTLFFPETPLHDGACIIHGDRITAAGCVLPLSDNPSLGITYGLRHRAALGMAEQNDSLCIVVSEETGHIAYGYKGKLITKVDAETLRKSMEEIIQE